MADTASVLTGGSNSKQTTAEELNAAMTDLIVDGVVGTITNTTGVAPMTGALAVNAQGTPNMTVAVTAGKCYVTATPTSQGSQRLRAVIAAQNVTIAANSTGGTRYDWIYVSISAANAANPSAAADNVASITQSRSTSISVDNGTPPTYGYCIAKVTVVNGAASIANAAITDARAQTGPAYVAASAGVGSPQVAAGVVVQTLSTNYNAVNSGTTVVPWDDTIPQITEGDEYMSLAITPKATTNILIIEIVAQLAANGVKMICGALFQDATANALAATSALEPVISAPVIMTLTHKITAGTTSATTFRFRAGGETAGTVTFNGAAAARKFGGITASSIKITEVKV